MPYYKTLANRIGQAFSGLKKVEEKKMMIGLTFMIDRKMCIGIVNSKKPNFILTSHIMILYPVSF